MTPLFDATITNIKLATHGRLEAMNAVLISSIAASTFNAQLEAWEPLVEPFDGIFKYISLFFLFAEYFECCFWFHWSSNVKTLFVSMVLCVFAITHFMLL